MTSPAEARLKRIRIRAWRRGMKEMDLILGGFTDRHLDTLSGTELDALESLMEENDQDLYRWVTGQGDVPPAHADLITRLAREFGAV